MRHDISAAPIRSRSPLSASRRYAPRYAWKIDALKTLGYLHITEVCMADILSGERIAADPREERANTPIIERNITKGLAAGGNREA
jgi:hypothetical protein